MTEPKGPPGKPAGWMSAVNAAVERGKVLKQQDPEADLAEEAKTVIGVPVGMVTPQEFDDDLDDSDVEEIEDEEMIGGDQFPVLVCECGERTQPVGRTGFRIGELVICICGSEYEFDGGGKQVLLHESASFRRLLAARAAMQEVEPEPEPPAFPADKELQLEPEVPAVDGEVDEGVLPRLEQEQHKVVNQYYTTKCKDGWGTNLTMLGLLLLITAVVAVTMGYLPNPRDLGILPGTTKFEGGGVLQAAVVVPAAVQPGILQTQVDLVQWRAKVDRRLKALETENGLLRRELVRLKAVAPAVDEQWHPVGGDTSLQQAFCSIVRHFKHDELECRSNRQRYDDEKLACIANAAWVKAHCR